MYALKRVGRVIRGVNGHQPAEGVSREHADSRRCDSVFSISGISSVWMKSRKGKRSPPPLVGSASVPSGFFSSEWLGVRVADAVRVGDAHNDERRHAVVVDQKVDGAADLVDVTGAVHQVQHGIGSRALIVVARQSVSRSSGPH